MRNLDRELPHGTANAYNNYRCRCAACREAWRVYYKEHRKGICPQCGGFTSDKLYALCNACHHKNLEPEHGTESRYARPRSCRCDLCRKAAADGRRRRRQAVAARG